MSAEKYEWVFGPIATQPAQRPRIEIVEGDPVYVYDGPFYCAVYGQVRRLRDGAILNWAKQTTLELADRRLWETEALHPKAVDWQEILRTDADGEVEPGEGDFEDGILCYNRMVLRPMEF